MPAAFSALVPNQAEASYLEDYLEREAKFDLIWSDLQEYAERLRQL